MIFDIIFDKSKKANNCINNSSRKLRNKKSLNCDKVETIRVSDSLKDCEDNYEWVTNLPKENRELVVNRWEEAVIWTAMRWTQSLSQRLFVPIRAMIVSYILMF